MVPPKFGPHGKMVPNQFCPPRQMVCILWGQEVGDQKSGVQMRRSCNKMLFEYIWAVRLGVRRGNTVAAVALSIHF